MTPPAEGPRASVDAIEPLAGSDRERVSVVLENDGNDSLESVTVVCPAGSTPRAFVDTLIEA
jgi:hypothetical protein